MRALFSIVLFLFFSVKIFCQTQALFDYRIYPHEKNNSYLELYFNFLGPSITPAIFSDSLHFGQIEMTVFIKKDTNIIQFTKRELKSPYQLDSVLYDFIELQRFELTAGTYNVEISFADINNEEAVPAQFENTITIPLIPTGKVSVAAPMILGNVTEAGQQTAFTKAGLNLYPYLSDYFPTEVSKLLFYSEIFNAVEGFEADSGKYAIRTKITNEKTGDVARNLQRMQRNNAETITPILSNFDISDLPSGSYNLVIEVLNTKGEIVASTKQTFKRSNQNVVANSASIEEMILNSPFLSSITSEDTLTEYLHCLRPIADANERRYIDMQHKRQALDEKKRFFYSFWVNRDAQNPDVAWLNYKEQVKIAEANFANHAMRGYQTDRGRVYLEYGPPNTRVQRPSEAGNYPYEIWQYYKIDNYNNKRFIFYSTNLANNDYTLLHSDMFGEVKNNNWESYLKQRNDPAYNSYGTSGNDYGNRSRDYFDNPR